ncbi:hypothetical protein ACB098_12G089900 [Castanea mollissima]
MASSLYHLKFVYLLSFLSTFHLIATRSFSSVQPLCRGHERSYLLQFKDSFVINKASSSEPWAYPKVASWALEGNNNDCCSWDGVECDEFTGHVIGLDLNSSCLYGSINSNSSLFHLVHLRRLNLADNDFNNSQIPSTISNLSKLTHLDLSFSVFASQIPLEVSQLSQLSSLNLGENSHLELKKPSLKSLVENLTSLEKLDLSGVKIISMVPTILANFSSLTFLSLSECRLHGEFPVGIFKLPNLRVLEVWNNEGLIGHLPDFQWSSTLERMDLSNTKFSGKLPASIGNLGSLTTISIWGCNFSGFIPSSLGNLTRLNSLDLSYNTFEGCIPSSFGNLIQLSLIFLSSNKFTGPIPLDLANLTKLTILLLDNNEFGGQIPSSIFNLTNLEFLDLSDNYFSGTVEFDKFVKLKKLTTLRLSHNQLSLVESETSANRTFQKFVSLGLSLCNLSKFPNFLANQDELELLFLQDNNIHEVPEWVWNMSKERLKVIGLNNNYLTSLGQHPILLPWTNLAILDISSNNIQGSLPIPSSSTLQYHASNNSFIGKISELICNLSSLQVLDLSENNLSGPLPQCLHSFGDSLVLLDIHRNKFEGSIPQTWANGSKLMIINFSENKFQGCLPRSLAKCITLKALDLSNNQFNDTFPSWLGNLPNLKILILRSNKFYGPIKIHSVNYEFPNLQIVDLSYNSFTGMLPVELFQNSNSSRSDHAYHLSYIQVNSSFEVNFSYRSFIFHFMYSFSMMMTNKGVDTIYEKVQEIFTALDFSSNRFAGDIPKSIGNIKVLRLLNLSNNILTGHIPPTLGNLAELESLDLSQNKLVGEIPKQLTQLTFLESFNVSHNDLVGLIPQGTQFNTFQNNSFEGNSKLCGNPLSKKCKIVMIGYGCGLLVGVAIGHIVIARNHDWLMKTFGVRQPVPGRKV